MHHECIRARHSSGALYRWEFERHGKVMRIDVSGYLTLDEPDMMAQSSRAGLHRSEARIDVSFTLSSLPCSFRLSWSFLV